MTPLATPTEIVPLIIFTLDGHPYAIETACVQEVLRMVAMAPAAGAPSWVAGMINLRGRPAAVIDLRRRFGLGTTECGLTTPIIVARTTSGQVVGLIADSITDLHDLERDAIFTGSERGLVTGVARIGSRLVNIADVDAIAAGTEQLLSQ